jgi:hypothetical protein
MAKDTSKFLNEKEATELFHNLQNDASVADSGDFIEVDISDDTYTNLLLNSPFFDFLKTKGRVYPTESAKGKFRNIVVPEASRAKFSANETGSDISSTDIDYDAAEYSTAVVARKIAVTDMFQTGNPGYDPMQDLREQATQDNYTAIDEGLFKTHIPNKFDGVEETSTNIVEMEGETITLQDLNNMVRKVMNNGGVVDGIIATGEAIFQLVEDDTDNQKVYANKADVILGKWATQIMTPGGLVPLIDDFNINNRFLDAPEPNSNAIYVVDSRALEVDVLKDSISRVLGASDFSDSELVGSFLRMGNLAPGKTGAITGIGSAESTSLTVQFTVINSVTEAPVSGAAVTVTQIVNGATIAKTVSTDADGKAAIAVNTGVEYALSVAKTGYTTYTDTISAENIEATETIELVAN